MGSGSKLAKGDVARNAEVGEVDARPQDVAVLASQMMGEALKGL